MIPEVCGVIRDGIEVDAVPLPAFVVERIAQIHQPFMLRTRFEAIDVEEIFRGLAHLHRAVPDVPNLVRFPCAYKGTIHG